MKALIKQGISIALAGIIAAAGVLSASAAQTPDTPQPESFVPALYADGNPDIPSENESSQDVIRWFAASNKGKTAAQLSAASSNGSYYLFLPTTADLSALTVWHNFSGPVTVNEKAINSGEKTDVFSQPGKYTVTADGTDYTVTVMQSSSIGSMYISTESGSMKSIHASKETKESGDILIVEADGTQDYSGELSYIKGRGNTTWRLNKKPYNIKLDKKASVLGMDASKKWCLLANGQDHSLIRNKIAYDLADELGLEFSPDSGYVDLYLNGDYAGVYQVSEKIDVGKNNLVKITDLEELTEKANEKAPEEYPQVKPQTVSGSLKYFDVPNDPEDITGGYLLEIDVASKYDTELSGFVTQRGQPVVVKGPEHASKKQIEYISTFFQELEDALLSIDGRNSLGRHYSEYIDINDAALMYLLEEYSLDIDAGTSSCFLYKESDANGDGKLHMGPAWDFDVAFGNLENKIDETQSLNMPDAMFVGKGYDYFLEDSNIFAKLCTHKDFCDEVKKLYNEKFAPALEILNSEDRVSGEHISSFPVYKELLASSAEMNFARWKLSDNILVTGVGKTFDKQFDYLARFSRERAEFFDRYFNTVETGDQLNIYFLNYDYTEHVYLYYINGKNKVEWPGIEMQPIKIDNMYKADLAALGEVDNGDIRFVITDGKDFTTAPVQAHNNIGISYYEGGIVYDDGHEEIHPSTFRNEFDESRIKEFSYIIGDVNGDGDINSEDALKILRFSVNPEEYTSSQEYFSSFIDSDSSVTSADALLVLRKSVGFEDEGSNAGRVISEYYYDYNDEE